MKRSFFKIIFLLVLLFSFSCVKALELCMPSDDYISYTKLSFEEKKKYIKPNYCKLIDKKDEVNILKPSKKSLLKNKLMSYPSSYNAYDESIVTSVKNQYNLGVCWAFAATSIIETNALKNNIGEYDFSEKHMVYSLLSAAYKDEEGKKGKYYVSDFEGGGMNYAASYFYNGYGLLLYEEMPYLSNNKPIYLSEYPKGRNIISVSKFEIDNVNSYASCTNDEINNIKNYIIKHGSIQGNMYMDESLFKDSNKDYYLSTIANSKFANHAVTIVGWDDNISKDNFNNASRDGAWIIKNSWGKSWSRDGLFYISYDDNFICKNIISYSGVSTTTFDNTYASSDMVGMPELEFDGTIYISSKFTLNSSNTQDIKRVSFAVGPNSSYDIYLSKDNNLNSQDNWILLSSGQSQTYGIDSIDVTDKKVNDDFTIIIKYSAPNETSSIMTMCSNDEDTSKMEYEKNRNFVSTNLTSWKDLASFTSTISCEPNIYVYTNDVDDGIKIESTNVNDNKVNIKITSDFDLNDFTYNIFDKNNENVTSLFTIDKNNETKIINLTSNNLISDSYKLVINYLDIEKIINFTLQDSIKTNDNKYKIDQTNYDIKIVSNGNQITIEDLLMSITNINTDIKVTDSKGNIINDITTNLKTNYKLKTNNKTYTIAILGDVNCDGRISALDYIEVKKHIMGTKITNHGKLIAADMDSNSNITALDYVAIRKILMR